MDILEVMFGTHPNFYNMQFFFYKLNFMNKWEVMIIGLYVILKAN